ncbi:MAG: hypothetical protein GTO18_13490 [Anaerolineales bacterium]|nr:hypothetical protein [Anaerolineales bacterium]
MNKPATLIELEKLEDLIQFQETLIKDLERENGRLRRELNALQIQQLELMLFNLRSKIEI